MSVLVGLENKTLHGDSNIRMWLWNWKSYPLVFSKQTIANGITYSFDRYNVAAVYSMT